MLTNNQLPTRIQGAPYPFKSCFKICIFEIISFPKVTLYVFIFNGYVTSIAFSLLVCLRQFYVSSSFFLFVFYSTALPKTRPDQTRPDLRHIYLFRNKASFYGEELLAPRPTPKMEDHPLSTVCDTLFNIFAATVHIGGNRRTRHGVVTGNPLNSIMLENNSVAELSFF